jgi:hypothetical protein
VDGNCSCLQQGRCNVNKLGLSLARRVRGNEERESSRLIAELVGQSGKSGSSDPDEGPSTLRFDK